jgi:hypothetical protein
MLFMCNPFTVFEVMWARDNAWHIPAPRYLWFALFYLFGSWFFEVCVLFHPATGAKKSYGMRGWMIQVGHHCGFPLLAFNNLYSGCAVPGTAVACCSELTLLFTSSYWLLKMVGVSDKKLVPIQYGMLISTVVFRGVFVLLLDYRALFNNMDDLPLPSLMIQGSALVLTNVLNLLILKLVLGAVTRKKKPRPAADAATAGSTVKNAEASTSAAAVEIKAAGIATGSKGAEQAAQVLRSMAPPQAASRGGPAPPSLTAIRDLMKKLAQEASGFEIDVDQPLMDSGMASKAAVVFRDRLEQELPQVHLPSTLIFDYPTITAMAGYAAEQLSSSASTVEQSGVVVVKSGLSSEPLGISGLACKFPGGAESAAQYLRMLAAGTEATIEVPFTRWDLDEYYSENPDAPGKTYARHGAFVNGVENFDASFFGISAPEARAMDPQQRMVLEVSHDSLHDGGICRRTCWSFGISGGS